MYEIPCTKDELARNYFRLVKLTMIEGTKAIRKTVFSMLPGGQTLHMVLRLQEDKIRSLSRGQRSVINSRQLAILYPEYGTCDLSAIDMTLWCALARNILSLPRGVVINWKDDDHPPSPGEEEWYHDITRIRLTRNRLFHLQRPELDEGTFQDLWNYVSKALRRLDPSIDFDSYLTAELDRSAARELEIQVKEQVLQEMNDVLRAELGGRWRFYWILAVAGVVMFAFLIATIVLSCHQESPCEKGVKFLSVGGSGAIHFVPRSAWGAVRPTRPYTYMDVPVSSALYGHTAEVTECSTTQDCCTQVKNIQILHMHPDTIDSFILKCGGGQNPLPTSIATSIVGQTPYIWENGGTPLPTSMAGLPSGSATDVSMLSTFMYFHVLDIAAGVTYNGVDISYHYLIDRNGYVFEGRPPNTVPGSRLSSNYTTCTYTSIALIGNFMYAEPTTAALAAFDILLEYLEDSLKILKKDFRLFAACEFFNTKSPGINLYRKINTLDAQQYPHIKKHVAYRNGSECAW